MQLKRTIVLDLEANGLLIDVTVIWCVATKCLETQEEYLFLDKSQFIEYIKQADVIIGHNILGYDLLVLKKIWGIDFSIGPDTLLGKKVEFIDTLVRSRCLWPDRPDGHSLEEWGNKLGLHKGNHTNFDYYSLEMGEYCQQDVRVTEQVYYTLIKEMNEG